MRLLYTLLLVAGISLGASAAAYDPQSAVPLADPFILCDDGIYYAYGTGSPDGIAVLVSPDLKRWYYPDGRAGYLALGKKDSYGERWFRAPEVYRIDDTYYMYYSADEHICVATAQSPLGPFLQTEKQPMLEEHGIDNTLFIDRDGTPYLFWVRLRQGNEIWMAQLEKDYKTVIPTTLRFCTRMWQNWERVWPAVNEGPFVVEHKGVYYLTYSANSCESPQYGIGCATARRITGPWKKYDDNPILQSPDGLVGVGHHAIFRDRKGRQRVVFHSHCGEACIHPRTMHITGLEFRKQPGMNDKLIISPDYYTPTLDKKREPKLKARTKNKD